MWVLLFASLAISAVFSAPLGDTSGQLGNVDLGVTVFNQNNAKSADQTKDYIIFAYDSDSCVGEKKANCDQLEAALFGTVAMQDAGDFAKFKDRIVMGKANKDDFPDHKKDLEQAKVPLPAVLFWPAGHSRPSCKFDSPNPTVDQMSQWMLAKLKDEAEDDESLLQLDEGDTTLDATPASERIDESSLLVCQADSKATAPTSSEDPACADLLDTSGLVQVGKTEKIWDYKTGSTQFVGPADNSLSHDIKAQDGAIKQLDAAAYKDLAQTGNYVALYFTAAWCHYCECLDPVWAGVAGNLVDTHRQPSLVVGKVNGDDNPELRNLFNVTVYPTFIFVNKEGSKVLGRYLGPRKVFELSTWIEDLIVADENPIVKKQFDASEQGEHTDMHPVYPYEGAAAFGGQKLVAQNLASLEMALGGNDFDECVDSDEKKFTASGAALLVHYPTEGSIRSLEMDLEQVSTERVPDKLTVVDFYAPWCSHCQKLGPVWDALASKVDGVVVGKVDMDAHTDVRKQFGIRRFPTIMYFEPGKKMSYDEARRYTGQRDIEHLQQWIEGLKTTNAAPVTPPTAK